VRSWPIPGIFRSMLPEPLYRGFVKTIEFAWWRQPQASSPRSPVMEPQATAETEGLRLTQKFLRASWEFIGPRRKPLYPRHIQQSHPPDRRSHRHHHHRCRRWSLRPQRHRWAGDRCRNFPADHGHARCGRKQSILKASTTARSSSWARSRVIADRYTTTSPPFQPR